MDMGQISKVYAQLDPPLWLVTAAHGERHGGIIATTVTQASIVSEMPRQLITVNKRHYTHGLIEGSGAFAMHLIDETQLALVWRFGLQSGRDVDKFAVWPFVPERPAARCCPKRWPGSTAGWKPAWIRATAPSTWLVSSRVDGNEPNRH
jgi:flavin reductase (DIM6/NTAB) family NADH-FMN oxidoreductase RutF